ncbi:protein NO VEIN domain-containing protein [Thermofilum adornatum]|nr:helicase-related protein [Thermofilum adornatum]
MALSLVHDVLDLYSRYNPILYLGLQRARPPVYPYLHQAEFLARTMVRVPVRVFVADEIGLGKTVTAISTAKRLSDLGLAKRVLILVPRILVRQWLLELERFGIRATRIERANFQSLSSSGFPEGFYVASMDLVKRERYMDKILGVSWDLLIVDEAHRVGKSSAKKETQRYRFVSRIAVDKSKHILLLSATPHRGDPKDYLSRLMLLDPSLTTDFQRLDNVLFYSATQNVLVFRRTKLDVNNVYEGEKVFPGCSVSAVIVPATRDESEFHRRLISFLRTKILDYHNVSGTEPRALGLLNALIFKRASSSPAAAINTMQVILEKRAYWLQNRVIAEKDLRKRINLAKALLGTGFEEYEEDVDPDKVVEEFAERCSILFSENDVRELQHLVQLAKASMTNDSRLKGVVSIVEQHVSMGDKVILFTEFKDTAHYVFDALVKVLGRENVRLLTSDEAAREEELMSIRSWLEENGKRVLVATDVASEGLNLQVANVLINYEPPWSPIKLEQRIGRVWRLGQKKDVNVYTVFLAVDSDKDVLDVLYKKLVAMGRALGKLEKPPVGEEAYVIDFEERREPQPVTLSIKSGSRLKKVSEYTLRRQYIEKGREGFERLVDSIARTIQQLQKDLEKVSGSKRLTREQIMQFMEKTTGFTSSKEALSYVARLVEAIGKRYPDLVQNKDGKIYVKAPGGALVPLDKAQEAIITLLSNIASRESKAKSAVPIIVSTGERDQEVRIYVVGISFRGGPTLYREPVAISDDGRIFRGKELLEILARAIENKYFDTVDTDVENQVPATDKHMLTLHIQGLARDLANDYERYRSQVAQQNLLREKSPQRLIESLSIEEPRLIGKIFFTSRASRLSEESLSLEEKAEIEAEAMRIAMEHERQQGREPLDVHEREHYDILSQDPVSGEVRYIEVKGHAGPSLMIELTEDEYRFASQNRDRYWIYIVRNIKLGRPELIPIRDPISKIDFRPVGALKFVGVPRGDLYGTS